MPADQLPRTVASLASALEVWGDQEPSRTSPAAVVRAIAEAGARLATVVATSPLVAGDERTPLPRRAEQLFVEALSGLDVAAVCSAEADEPVVVTRGGSLVVTLDPLDGASNLDANAPIGTIFAVLPAVLPAVDPAVESTGDPAVDPAGPAAALLRPGRHQLAAGIIAYGPGTVLALTLGEGTDVYGLDPGSGEFVLARQRVQLPTESREYAINASNARHWGPGIREYVGDLVSGALGPRERDFTMRWLASLVAEAYRILIRGGIFLYPADARPGCRNGRIRLVHQANPVAFLCEQAGGAATDGVTPILDLRPTHPRQRVPFVFGSRRKVERVRRYLLEPATAHERSPLFSPRGLFRS